MKEKAEENYLNNGEKLQEIIQEWIDENGYILYYTLQRKESELENR